VFEVPTELVSVTDTDAMLEMLPLTAKGTVSENCEPVASDFALPYHAANRLLTSMVTLVVCRFAPAAGVNWNVAVFMSSVVDVPTTTTLMPVVVVVTVTLLIVGADAAMVVVAEGATEGVIFTPAALSESDISMVPGSVPTWNCSVAVVVLAGIVICVVREPPGKLRSLELPGFGVMESVAVTVMGSG